MALLLSLAKVQKFTKPVTRFSVHPTVAVDHYRHEAIIITTITIAILILIRRIFVTITTAILTTATTTSQIRDLVKNRIARARQFALNCEESSWFQVSISMYGYECFPRTSICIACAFAFITVYKLCFSVRSIVVACVIISIACVLVYAFSVTIVGGWRSSAPDVHTH